LGDRLIDYLHDVNMSSRQIMVDTIDEVLEPSLEKEETDANGSNATGISPDIVCDAVFRSPIFRVFCRRRRRFALEPTAPIAPSKPKSQSKSSTSLSSSSSSSGANGSLLDKSKTSLSSANSRKHRTNRPNNSTQKSTKSSRRTGLLLSPLRAAGTMQDIV